MYTAGSEHHFYQIAQALRAARQPPAQQRNSCHCSAATNDRTRTGIASPEKFSEACAEICQHEAAAAARSDEESAKELPKSSKVWIHWPWQRFRASTEERGQSGPGGSQVVPG